MKINNKKILKQDFDYLIEKIAKNLDQQNPVKL